MTREEQQLGALEKANRVRIAQAVALREIRAGGREAAAALLRDPDEIQASLRLERVLFSVPRFGPKRSMRLLKATGVTAVRLRRRIRELTERERLAIADELVAPPRQRGCQEEVLAAVNGEPLTARELHERIDAVTTVPAVARALAELRKHGLVEAQPTGRNRQAFRWRKASR